MASSDAAVIALVSHQPNYAAMTPEVPKSSVNTQNPFNQLLFLVCD